MSTSIQSRKHARSPYAARSSTLALLATSLSLPLAAQTTAQQQQQQRQADKEPCRPSR